MRVFKHLIALADIAVGFLGLFIIIFAVTRPCLRDTTAALAQKDAELAQLQQKLHELEELQLPESATGRQMSDAEAGKIILTDSEIRVDLNGKKSTFASVDAFQSATAGLTWPQIVVLYVDRRVTFDKVVEVIDYLKQTQQNISVRIAARSVRH